MKLIKLEQALQLSAVSRSTFYQNIKHGLMTPPVSLSAHSVAWPEPEIIAINLARIAGKTDDQIRVEVVELIKQRQAV